MNRYRRTAPMLWADLRDIARSVGAWLRGRGFYAPKPS